MPASLAARPRRASMRLLAAPDKFRGSLTATQASHAIAAGASSHVGWIVGELPLADGGEGTLDALGGANRRSVVTGPLGQAIEAAWQLSDGLAVVEMAKASGLALVGGPQRNDPLRATTLGTGELIAAALDLGVQRIIVGVGGSATTDGGLGAVEVLRAKAPFAVSVQVACDVQTLFLDAAAVYAPQKGASPEQVAVLAERLHELVDRYRREFGVDISHLPGGGAAGGLAGGLAALGAELTPGFDLVAGAVGLDAELSHADLVVTGEGYLDATSFAGKVVGGVVERAAGSGVPSLVIAGDIAPSLAPTVSMISLVAKFGVERAWSGTEECIAHTVADVLRQHDEAPRAPGSLPKEKKER